jgi:hypothetical protein
VAFGHLRLSGHIMPDHAGDRGAAHLDPCGLGEGQPGELGGGAGARSRAWLRRRGQAGGGVEAFSSGAGSSGLGGALLGFAQVGDGFGERCKPAQGAARPVSTGGPAPGERQKTK